MEPVRIPVASLVTVVKSSLQTECKTLVASKAWSKLRTFTYRADTQGYTLMRIL